MLVRRRGGWRRAYPEARGGLTPQGDFRTVHAKDTRIASGRAPRRSYGVTGDKPEFHQPARHIIGKIEAVQNALFALAQLDEGRRPAGETGLHELSVSNLGGYSVKIYLQQICN